MGFLPEDSPDLTVSSLLTSFDSFLQILKAKSNELRRIADLGIKIAFVAYLIEN